MEKCETIWFKGRVAPHATSRKDRVLNSIVHVGL